MAEEKTATLLRQKAIEDKKMRELEKIREQLETCLDEERQAKKDEEIVRQLQARVLEEEWGRREALEKLQEEQRMMLEEERRKREAFEQQQSEKESQLRGKFIFAWPCAYPDPDPRNLKRSLRDLKDLLPFFGYLACSRNWLTRASHVPLLCVPKQNAKIIALVMQLVTQKSDATASPELSFFHI